MKVALVNPPYFDSSFMENVGIVENKARKLPPLSIMYVSSILKKNGHESIIVDAVAEKLSENDVAKILRKFNPDIIGFSILTPSIRRAFEFMGYLKEKLSVPVVAGGHMIQYYPEAILSNKVIDYIVIGSAIHSFPKLLEALENGGELNKIKGIGFKKEGRLIINYPDDMRKRINELPFPDREGINNHLYYSIVSDERPYTIMITSSGCIYKCSFCPMGRLPYEERNIEDVVDEIEECVKKYGIREIDIQDDNFLLNKERAIDIMEEIARRNIDVKISCRARVDSIDENVLKILKNGGCNLIMYGIESGNDEILRKEHKGITKREIEKIVKMTKKHGIKTLGFFIVGNKGETRKTIVQSISFSRKLPLDYVQFFHMVIKPGTELYDDIKEREKKDYFEMLLRNKVKAVNIKLPWTRLSNTELKLWVIIAYMLFYMRRGYFKKLLKFIFG